MTPFPQTPLTEGRDSHGSPVRLGDLDSDGVPVGYIDPSGLAWASRLEAECSILAGRLQDAHDDVQRAGHLPDVRKIVEETTSPDHRAEALLEAHESLVWTLWMRRVVASDPK